jgi:hypothetical protein
MLKLKDEIYIQMCKQSQEIQDIWAPKRLDFYYSWPCGGEIEVWLEIGGSYPLRTNDMIWIPRMEQLQKLISFDGYRALFYSTLLKCFYDFITTDIAKYMKGNYKGDELWLWYYMEVEHNKRWDADSKTWIDKTEEYNVETTIHLPCPKK